MYNVIESSPDDQIQPKLFVHINSTNIYILSTKFVLNRSISMELRFKIHYSHCQEDGIILYSILKEFKEFWAIAHLTHSKKPGFTQDPPSAVGGRRDGSWCELVLVQCSTTNMVQYVHLFLFTSYDWSNLKDLCCKQSPYLKPIFESSNWPLISLNNSHSHNNNKMLCRLRFWQDSTTSSKN
jgi:hypothetical protein